METGSALDRLYKLRSIFEEGFISESEYLSRRAQLVDQLTGTSIETKEKTPLSSNANETSLNSLPITTGQKRIRPTETSTSSSSSSPDIINTKKRKSEISIPAQTIPKPLIEENCGICFKTFGKKLCISCDRCEKWFHITCVGVKRNQVPALEEWFCSACSVSSPVSSSVNLNNTNSSLPTLDPNTNSPAPLSPVRSCTSPTPDAKQKESSDKENMNSNISPVSTFYFLSPITKAATAMTKLKQDSSSFKVPAKPKLIFLSSSSCSSSKLEGEIEQEKYVSAAEVILRKEGKSLTSSELVEIALKEKLIEPSTEGISLMKKTLSTLSSSNTKFQKNGETFSLISSSPFPKLNFKFE